MIQRRSHRPISSRHAIKRQPHFSVLNVLGGLVMQQFVGAVGPHAVGRGEGSLLLPHGHGESGQANTDVFEGVEQEDAHDDGEEATEGADHVVRAHVTPLLEEDGGAGEHGCGEEHVIDGSHQGGVEYVQSLVQVVDLCAHTGHKTQKQDPRQRVPHNVFTSDRFLDGDAQSFDARHRQRPDYRADGDVDEDVGLTVAGTHDKNEDEGHDDDESGKDKKPYGEKKSKGVLESTKLQPKIKQT